MKRYEIIYTPMLTTAEVIKAPYDIWDYKCRPDNLSIVNNHNHLREKKESVVVEANTKKLAEAMFAVHIYQRYMTFGINGGWTPLFTDAIRNIESVTEVNPLAERIGDFEKSVAETARELRELVGDAND